MVNSAAISAANFNIQFQLENNNVDDEFLSNKVKNITDCAQYLTKTMDSFKNFISNNRSSSKFDIIETIKECISIESGVISSNDITIVSKLDKKIIVDSFENEFLQVLISIVNNSIDVLKTIDSERRVIMLEAKEYEDNIIINIKDSGGGFKDEIIESIFEPYVTTKHKSMGIGLGLYTVYKIITSNMNGTVLASNEKLVFKDKEFIGASIQIEFDKSRVSA